LGEATAKMFALEGASVVIAARRESELKRVANDIISAGGNVLAVVTDICNTEQVENLFAKAAEKFGKIDILINAAGIVDTVQSLDTTSDEMFTRLLNTNTVGTFHCMREVLKYMIAAKSGSIVNVASVAGKFGLGGAAYSASKGGVVALTKSAAIRYYQDGIRCNVICPGSIVTPMVTPEKMKDSDRSMISVIMAHEAAEVAVSLPDEQAKLLLFLASDDSVVLNGQAITSDKGATL
ncbi:MAG: SDR family oxidoreductase, partial [Oscillospiraceae bacterium]